MRNLRGIKIEPAEVKLRGIDGVYVKVEEDIEREDTSSGDVAQVLIGQDRKSRVKKELRLDRASIEARLSAINYKPVVIGLDPDVVMQTISREFFGTRYGGNKQRAFPFPRKALIEKHGMTHMAFMTAEWNPYLPRRPGWPGLAFCSTSARDEDQDSISVFTRQKKTEPKQSVPWMYDGEYKFRPSTPLTPDEWRAQTPLVRSKWIETGYLNSGWGKRAKAEIVLQVELGRKPTEAEVEEAVQEGRHSEATKEMIEEALNQGTQRVPVCTLECVEYREDFQEELLAGFRSPSETWKILPPNPCKKRKFEDMKAQNSHGSVKGESSEDAPRRKRRPRSMSPEL